MTGSTERTDVMLGLSVEDAATDAVHELSLVSELLGSVGRDGVILSGHATDGLDLIIRRAVETVENLLGHLEDERVKRGGTFVPRDVA